jgi:hypothetical protein
MASNASPHVPYWCHLVGSELRARIQLRELVSSEGGGGRNKKARPLVSHQFPLIIQNIFRLILEYHFNI